MKDSSEIMDDVKARSSRSSVMTSCKIWCPGVAWLKSAGCGWMFHFLHLLVQKCHGKSVIVTGHPLNKQNSTVFVMPLSRFINTLNTDRNFGHERGILLIQLNWAVLSTHIDSEYMIIIMNLIYCYSLSW
jgi:hypothetical protein